MDFSSILSYLQTLLNNKQGMIRDQYSSNLGLQRDLLNQRGQQFNTTEANAMKRYADSLAAQKEQFAREYDLKNRMSITPGSPDWYQMLFAQNAGGSSKDSELAANKFLTSGTDPVKYMITPYGTGW